MRTRLIPNDPIMVLEYNDVSAVVYVRNGTQGRFLGKAFAGKSIKHAWYESFRSMEALQERVAKWIDRLRQIKQEKTDQRKARQNYINPFKPGDIFSSSWGYDQTNVDFYAVVAAKPKSLIVQRIGAKHTEGKNGMSSMSGYVIPNPEHIESKPFLVKLQTYNGSSFHFSPHGKSYRSASPWDGKPEYMSWYA